VILREEDRQYGMDVVHVGDEVHIDDTGVICDWHVFVPAEHTDAFAAEPKVNATKQIARLGGECGHCACVSAIYRSDDCAAASFDAAMRDVVQRVLAARP
jgi:hypothetical protein